MVDLATVDDLTAYGVPTSDTELVASLLASVSAGVRDAAGHPITSTRVTIPLVPVHGRSLPLPVKPVTDLHSVTCNGVTVTDYVNYGDRLWRAGGWVLDGPQPVILDLTFGYATVPADIVQLVCMLVGAGVYAAEDGGLGSRRGVAYESIDDARVGYTQGENEVFDPASVPERTRKMLRERFAGAVDVTGGY